MNEICNHRRLGFLLTVIGAKEEHADAFQCKDCGVVSYSKNIPPGDPYAEIADLKQRAKEREASYLSANAILAGEIADLRAEVLIERARAGEVQRQMFDSLDREGHRIEAQREQIEELCRRLAGSEAGFDEAMHVASVWEGEARALRAAGDKAKNKL